MLSRITAATLALGCAITLTGCGDDDEDDNRVGPSTQNASVRFVNASSGLTFGVFRGGSAVTGASSVAPGSAACARVNAASPSLAVRAAGGTANLTGFTQPTISANQTATVVVTGTATAPVFTTLAAETVPTPGASQAVVRVVNVSTGGNFDIYANPPATGTPAVSAAGLNTTSNRSAFISNLPAGSTTIRIQTAGGSATGTPLLNVPAFTVAAGDVRTVVIGGTATAPTATVVATPACPTT